MTEIKFRGPLTNKQLTVLTEHLRQKGKLLQEEYEKVVFFDTSIFSDIGDFTTGCARISIKQQRRRVQLRMKEGNPSNSERKVMAVTLSKKDTQSFLYILNRLGLKLGFYRPAFRQEYEFADFRVVIKTKCIMGDHFEIVLSDKVLLSDWEVQLLLKKCKLSLWSKDEYQHAIAKNIKAHPAADIYKSNIFAL